MTMKVLLVSANYPDKYHIWGPWNKEANIALSKIETLDTEVIAPRPYSLPFKWFPHNEMCSIPVIEKDIEGTIHHPRFFYPVPKKIFYPIIGDLYGRSVSKYLSKNIPKVALIHCHHVYPDAYGLINLSKKNGVPFVIDIHGDMLFKNWMNNSLLQKKLNKALDNSDKIICISKNIYSLAEDYGIPNEKLEFVPLGIDITKYNPTNEKNLSEIKTVKNKITILYVGQLIERKGISILISAINMIHLPERKKCQFIIVGDGPEKHNLIQLSRKLGIDKETQFLGKVSDQELIKWYASADIFVLPSFSEGRPTVINEAMASGCAIVATNVSGIPEQVKEGYNGFLVDPGDPKVLAERIDYLLTNEDDLVRMGKNSRMRVIEEGWTWENYAKKVSEIYDQVLNLSG